MSRFHEPIRGRGTRESPPNRFEHQALEIDLEALRVARTVHDEGEKEPDPHTRFLVDSTRSALSKNDNLDVGFNFGINPYRGCEHGCIYCYARPTHEFLGFSAGLDFESAILVKTALPDLLRKALRARSWQPQVIGMSGVTDCYQPVERRLGITRRCLEVLAEFRNPVAIVTKSRLITRDLDVLGELARHDAVSTTLSLTSLDPDLCRILEPRASQPGTRLAAVRALADAGIPVGVYLAPLIPGINDHEVPALLEAARDAGARWANYIPLSLPWAVKDLFATWLEDHFPERKEKVLRKVLDFRNSRSRDSQSGVKTRDPGVYAGQMRRIFEVSRQRAGFRSDEFCEPSATSFRRTSEAQIELF